MKWRNSFGINGNINICAVHFLFLNRLINDEQGRYGDMTRAGVFSSARCKLESHKCLLCLIHI